MNHSVRLAILWVDDDAEVQATAKLVHGRDHQIEFASSVEAAKTRLAADYYDAVIVDLNFEGQESDGIALLDWVETKALQSQMVVLSGDANTRRVAEAARRPGVDFIVKGPGSDEELGVVFTRIRAIRDLQAENATYFFSRSPVIQQLLRDVRKICSSNTKSSILLEGETGTGKEQLAKEISRLMRKKLIAVNMATLSRERAEAELFGHRKGAFTGAHRDEPGLLRQAHNGLFFMDEIGECSAEVQSKLLRVLQEKEVVPVGAVVPSKIDLQFISATHRSLDAMVEDGTFRLDLYQRISTFVLRIPPLRERPEDIAPLLFKFLDESSPEHRYQLSQDAMEHIVGHSWPGNVRELRSFAERCVVLSISRTIDAETVRQLLKGCRAFPTLEELEGLTPREVLQRNNLIAVMESVGGNRVKAGLRLGVSERTIYRLLNRYSLKQWKIGTEPEVTEAHV